MNRRWCVWVLSLFLFVGYAGVAHGQVTDGQGYITSDNWLALGPFANSFGCSGNNADITTLHIAPSFIQCQYPEDGDPVEYDPAIASTAGLHPQSPVDGDGNPVWYLYDDLSPDCDLDMDAVFGDISDHNFYVATYVEYTGAGPIDIEICGNSDDGLQVWWDDQLVINNNACRGRGGCAGGACNDVGVVTVTPGCHRIIMGVWERAGGFGGSLRLQEAGLPILDGGDWVFSGVEPCGEAPACAEPATRTVAPITCPTDEISVSIQQPLPAGADANEQVTVVECVSGEFGAAAVTAANGGVVGPLFPPGTPVGQFADHVNIITNPSCAPSNGDTVEGPVGTYTLTNTGEDIWTNGDTCQFAYNCVEGDFDVSIHVVSRTPSAGSRWGKHGIMARQSLDPRSRYSWTHDAVGDITAGVQNNDESNRHASRPVHLGAMNFEVTPFGSNPSGDQMPLDDYCDGEGPDDGQGCADASCPDAREAGNCVVHDDYMRLVRTGSLFESFSRASPDDPWTFLGSHDWGLDAPDTVLVGLAVTSHSTDCGSMIEVTFDQVDFGDATIVPCGDPMLGAKIEWDVTRQQLADGVSYDVAIETGTVGFDGTVDGTPIAVVSTRPLDVCLPFTTADGTFQPGAFLAYGPFAPSGAQIPCGGAPDELQANFISPEEVTCWAPAEGDEPGWDGEYDPALALLGTYFGPTGPGGDPMVRLYGGSLPDLNTEFGGNDRVQWMITYIENDTGADQDVEFCVNTDDGGVLVVDAEFVLVNNVCRGVGGFCDQDTAVVTLSPGPHVIKVAAFNRGGGWGVNLRMRETGGFQAPIVDGTPGWIFHGPNRPGDADDYPCEDLPTVVGPVTDLVCARNGDGGVDASWTNPPDLTAMIDISVNGVIIDTVPASTTSYTVDEGDLGVESVASILVQPQGALVAASCAVLLGNEVYINCGGPEVVDLAGRRWLADELGAPSGFLTSPDQQFANTGLPTDLLSDPHILDEEYPPEIFSVERWNDGPVEYTFTGLAPGNYQVALLFMEHCCSDGCLDAEIDPDVCDAVSEDEFGPVIDPQTQSSSCRVFDIYLNGELRRDRFSKSVAAACVAGVPAGPTAYGIGVSVVETVNTADGTIVVLIEDRGAGNPPENASIKGICITPSGGPPPTDIFKRGDADGVGAVNLTDGVFKLNFLFLGGPPPPCEDAADANDDEALNITGAVFIFNFLFLGGPPPPPPGHLACGADPVGSDLGCASYDNCP